jgi:hypothetical protein
MRQSETSSEANNSTLTAPVPEVQDILNLSDREIAKSFCKVQNFVYICIGKRTVQSTQDISYPHYSGVPGAVPFFGTVRLPKHKGASLFLYTYTK